MEMRQFGFLDRVIGEIDKAINVLGASARALRDMPEAPAQWRATQLPATATDASGVAASAAVPQTPPPDLTDAERRQSCRLMRVNHAGEVSAQALYRGQALTAGDPAVADAMRRAATEETDHLAWCEQRLRELDGRVSLLNPLWYAGSFAIGALAGALGGDRASLGFIAETERQVESHLSDHLGRLPEADGRSRAVLEQMKQDEMHHGAQATAMGGESLPTPVRGAMHLMSRVMTGATYWI
jgi:ubiquinone biosynthesis monooxygenase Coq7